MFLSKCISLEKTILNSLFLKSRCVIGLQIDVKLYNTQPAPKIKFRPKPAFFMFSSDNLQSIRQKNPTLPITQLAKILGQMWRELPQEEKNQYKLQYSEQKKILESERKLYFDQMDEAEKKKYIVEQGELKQKTRLKRIKALQKKFNKPKSSGVNPYVLFLKSRFLDRGDAPFLDYARGLRDFWLKMTEEDKLPFVTQARENTTRYKRQLAEWDRRMLASGHKSLISKFRLNALLRKPYIATRPKIKTKATTKTKATPSHKVAPEKSKDKMVATSTRKSDKKEAKKFSEISTKKIEPEPQLAKLFKSLEETIKREIKDTATAKDKTNQTPKSSKKN